MSKLLKRIGTSTGTLREIKRVGGKNRVYLYIRVIVDVTKPLHTGKIVLLGKPQLV